MAQQKNGQENRNEENQAGVFNKTEKFIQKNLNILIGAIVVILVLILGSIYYGNYQQEQADIAYEKMYRSEQLFAIDSFQLALGDESTTGFLYIIDEYGSTSAGNLAQAYAGLCYYRLGDYKAALSHLNHFDTDASLISQAIVGAKGDCYMELGDFSKACTFFKKAARNDKNDITTPFYLNKWGIALEKSGNYKQAIKVYTELKEEFSSSPEAASADKGIARATINL